MDGLRTKFGPITIQRNIGASGTQRGWRVSSAVGTEVVRDLAPALRRHGLHEADISPAIIGAQRWGKFTAGAVEAARGEDQRQLKLGI
jgi:hypothetical protein